MHSACRFDKSIVQVDPSQYETMGDVEQARNVFEFELCYIKAIPSGSEPTFVLLSCAGSSSNPFSTEDRRVAIKRQGETGLRLSGVPYMVVRPGKLVQEPGGYRALVFDQGNRIERVRR